MEGTAPHCVVIFGSTGDLAKKKLLSALNTLVAGKGHSFPIICCGRKNLSREEYFEYVGISEMEKNFREKIDYFHLDFENPNIEKFLKLAKSLNDKFDCRGRYVFYFSLPADVFPDSIEFIKKSGICQDNRNIKLAFEKPFGTDLESAKQLQKNIKKVFLDDQVYLVDHYLGKDFIQNLLVLRFTNRMLDQVWSCDHIDRVLITLSEKSGVNGRGSFYEKAGVIRDVVQNHILQLVSLIGMDCPESWLTNDVKVKKAAFLSKLHCVDKENIIIGQYQSGEIEDENVIGYRDEEGVQRDSETETFIAFQFCVDHPAWKGVPWHVKTGKRLGQNRMDIQIVLKKTDKLIENQKSTRIHLRQKPKTEISISFNTKEIGERKGIRIKELDFCFSCESGVHTPDAYELILEDIMKGDHTIFVSWEEVFESWRFTDDLIEKSNALKPAHLHFYSAGTDGPEQKFKKFGYE